ncbi:MAG TPA: HD domain-containing phosphohydrolase [Solirubrobacterales bacterium]|nr:HD domain-containing phosphohydrolase [Solirubrobacterales bacterium]
MTVSNAALKRARILIVDDEPANVLLLERLLERAGYENFVSVTDSAQVLALCTQRPPDLVLLDLHMPTPDGFEVMRQLDPWISQGALAVIVLTADTTREVRQAALSGGAKDFLVKPLDAIEVLLRIKNQLETRLLHVELRRQALALEQRVYEQHEDLDEARLEMLQRLARASEYRDDDTGEHTQRVGQTSALVARALDLSEEDVTIIRHAATLHDLGKIAVPDRVLLKPGSLDEHELEAMRKHVRMGADMLANSRSPLLQVAESIALTHHEWWDGSGYLSGLRGDEIPLPGRIVAIADVFDALTHDRPYKRALPLEMALDEVRSLRGSQFDPRVVDAFNTLPHEELLDLGNLRAAA